MMAHYRAVMLQILLLEDAHVSANDLREWVMEAIELHVEPRQVEVEVMEDVPIYADAEEPAEA